MPRILLVEDNGGDIFLIRRALAEHGVEHQLEVVHDGEEAIEFLSRMGQVGRSCRIDLLLLDLNLPKVDGAQVLTTLRKNPGCGMTPVIVVSSSNAAVDRDRMAALGVTRYFQKPTDLDEFMQLGAVIRDVLSAL